MRTRLVVYKTVPTVLRPHFNVICDRILRLILHSMSVLLFSRSWSQGCFRHTSKLVPLISSTVVPLISNLR